MKQYLRIGSYKPEEVLPFIGTEDKEYQDTMVHMDSARYYTFKEGLQCCDCGLVGSVFHLEKNQLNPKGNPDRFHFNFYAYDKDGNEILMTKDHIIPVSKGGKNHKSNYQTMCIVCNLKKGNNINGISNRTTD